MMYNTSIFNTAMNVRGACTIPKKLFCCQPRALKSDDRLMYAFLGVQSSINKLRPPEYGGLNALALAAMQPQHSAALVTALMTGGGSSSSSSGSADPLVFMAPTRYVPVEVPVTPLALAIARSPQIGPEAAKVGMMQAISRCCLFLVNMVYMVFMVQ